MVKSATIRLASDYLSAWVPLVQKVSPRHLMVVVGEHDLDHVEGPEVKLAVSEVRVHPWYDHHTFDNDIGKAVQYVLG